MVVIEDGIDAGGEDCMWLPGQWGGESLWVVGWLGGCTGGDVL